MTEVKTASSHFRSPVWALVTLSALMAIMVCQHIFPGWSYVVKADGEFRLPDPDAYYHFRQAAYTLEHFPHLLRWEDLSFYPEMIRNDAAGLYDLALASLAKLVALFGIQPIRALWWVCLWFPPLCATAIMPMIYLLVRNQGTVALGLVMASWYVLLPGLTLGHVTLGICDHHVVEMFCGVLCILLLKRLVIRERETPSAWWRPAWGAALPLALFQFTWLGAPLFLVIFAVACFGQLAADVLSGVGARPMVRSGMRYWLAFFLLTGGAGTLCPDIIFLPDIWQATLVGTVTLLASLAAAGWFLDTPRIRIRPAVRLAILACGFAALAAAAYAVSPKIRELAAEGLGHKSLSVAENQIVTGRLYFGVTGLAGILGLFAPFTGAIFGAWRRPAWWIGVLPSLLFVAFWYRTYDYGYQGALHAILLSGYFFGSLWGTWNLSWRKPLSRGLNLALAATTVAVVLCGWPTHLTAPWWLDGDWYENSSGLPNDGWIEAMRWLRTATPSPPEPLAHPLPGQPPRGRVGVLTDWCDGNFVNTLAGRPSTSSRYPVADAMAPLFMTREDSVRATVLRGSTVANAVRYVALSPRTIGDFFYTHLETVGLKAKDYYGRASFLDRQGRQVGVPTLGPAYDSAFATRLLVQDGNGLSHFRLVFESRQRSFLRMTVYPGTKAVLPTATTLYREAQQTTASNDIGFGLWQEYRAYAYFGHLLAAVKIFEQVEGARIEGLAPPGSSVSLEIPLRLRTSGRGWRYRQTCSVGKDGRFQMTEPYATETIPESDVETTGPATLALESVPSVGTVQGSSKAVLTITELEVQRGDLVSWGGRIGRPGQ